MSAPPVTKGGGTVAEAERACARCEASLKQVLGRTSGDRRCKYLRAAIDRAIAPDDSDGHADERAVAAKIHDGQSLPHFRILCKICGDRGPEGVARAFFGDDPVPSVTLCANRLFGDAEVAEALVHELVHAYDYVAQGYDLSESPYLACSEVRAAREAECHELPFFCPSGADLAATVGTPVTKVKEDADDPKSYMTEPSPIHRMCNWWHRRCVRMNATKATSSMVPVDVAHDCVAQVFEECYANNAPFDHVDDADA